MSNDLTFVPFLIFFVFQPAKPAQKASSVIAASKTNQSVAALNVPSIWNMVVDTNTTAKSANAKKDRKKKVIISAYFSKILPSYRQSIQPR